MWLHVSRIPITSATADQLYLLLLLRRHRPLISTATPVLLTACSSTSSCATQSNPSSLVHRSIAATRKRADDAAPLMRSSFRSPTLARRRKRRSTGTHERTRGQIVQAQVYLSMIYEGVILRGIGGSSVVVSGSYTVAGAGGCLM